MHTSLWGTNDGVVKVRQDYYDFHDDSAADVKDFTRLNTHVGGLQLT